MTSREARDSHFSPYLAESRSRDEITYAKTSAWRDADFAMDPTFLGLHEASSMLNECLFGADRFLVFSPSVQDCLHGSAPL